MVEWIGPNIVIHLMMKISVVVFSKKKKRKKEKKKRKKEKRKNKNNGHMPVIFIGFWLHN